MYQHQSPPGVLRRGANSPEQQAGRVPADRWGPGHDDVTMWSLTSTAGIYNERPLYTSVSSNNGDEFLFYLRSKNKGLWMVGPESGQFNGGLAHRWGQTSQAMSDIASSYKTVDSGARYFILIQTNIRMTSWWSCFVDLIHHIMSADGCTFPIWRFEVIFISTLRTEHAIFATSPPNI